MTRKQFTLSLNHFVSVADPGFPVGGRGPIRGHGPPIRALFGENVCENERVGSCRGRAPGTPPRCTNVCGLIFMDLLFATYID